MRLSIVLATVLAFIASISQASVIDVGSPRVVVESGIEYLIEHDSALSVEQVRALGHVDQWRSLDGDINMGYELNFIWYRFTVRNPAPEPVTRYFEIAYPLLDRIELFQFDQGRLIEHRLSGDHMPHHQRPIDYRHVVFPLELRADGQSEILLRIQTTGAHRAPIRIWEPSEFERAARHDMTLMGAIYGTVFAIGLLNVLLFFGIGQRQFLYLGSMMLFILMAMGALHGTAFQHVYPAWPQLHDRMVLVTVPLMSLFLLAFTSRFLRLDEKLPTAARISRGLMILTGLSATGGLFLPYALSMRASASLVVIVSGALLATALILICRGNRNARFYLLAWLPLLLGSIGKVLVFSGVFSNRLISDYAWEFGTVGASLIFSYVLAEQFHYERKKRLADQQARIQILHEREQAERRSAQEARRHPLTGLPNRSALESQLAREITQPGSLALVLLHVKGFDDFNRTLGHENADMLLTQFTRRLNQHATSIPEHVPIDSASDQPAALAHMDGLTLGCALRISSREEITTVMESLAQKARARLTFHGMELSLDIFLGCAVYPDDSPDVATLLRHAFIAYGQADSNVDHMAIYDEQTDPYSHRRLTLMPELKQAIENNDLMLYFQPQLRVDTAEISGFEALLRWNHPTHGFVPPDEFIPMAEQAGLMRQLTAWVLEHALAFCRHLKESGHPARISVNISAINLRDEQFSTFVRQVLERQHVEAGRLMLEITETAAMRHPEQTAATLRELNGLGVGVSIDDFGTGHSSLSYLSQLPVHEIKIDRSFILDIDRNPDNQTIARTTINMCHDLGYRVTAEGIESQAALELLKFMGCDVAQGYYLSHPLSQDDLLEWLKTRKKSAGA